MPLHNLPDWLRQAVADRVVLMDETNGEIITHCAVCLATRAQDETC